ncbi:S1C family serine protease [Bacillus piscicola]|uniref:S1C family serine protease n=1 Tax=Bacillus piscicola TaxID=1632684 RepID=UPI001F0941A6|nr:serine protease [Bacillus piscicola]
MTDKNRTDHLYDEQYEDLSYEEFQELVAEEAAEDGDKSKKKETKRKKPRWSIRIIAVFISLIMVFQAASMLFDTFRLDALEFLQTSYRLSQNETIQQWKEAVVTISGEGPEGSSKGTGFFINKEGYLLTNHHVIEDHYSIGVTTEKGDVLKGEVLASNADQDLALVKVEGDQPYPYLPIEEKASEAGEHIYVIGNPLSFTKIANEGTVLKKQLTNGRALGISAPIYRGNSGSPVISEQGKVIGVVYAKRKLARPNRQESIGLAVPLAEVNQFLEEELPDE